MKPAPSGANLRAALLSCATWCAISSAHAQSGTWSGTTSPGLWSNTANWAGGVVADGAGNTADFSTLDLPDGPFIAALDAPRTLGNLTFGDINTTTVGSWLVDNNVDPLNILTLAGSPVITVNALGTGATAEISAQIAGTAGLSKAGPRTLTLSGANTYSGTTTVSAGTLNINNATAIGNSTLTLAGGNIGNSGAAVTLTNNNAQNWNSNFTFAGPNNLAMGTGAISIPGAITVNTTAGQLNLGGVITSSANFTKDGAGEILLSGTNVATFTGPMTLKGGLLRIRGNLATGATGAALNQEPIGSLSKTITFEGGSLMLNGATGSNGPTVVAFTNPLVVAAGQTGTVYMPQRGDLNSTITGGGTLNLACNYVRGAGNGNWTGFTGTVNFSGVTAGNSDFRVNGTNMFHAGLTVNITNASVYQIFNPPNNAVGTTHQIGKLSGSNVAFMGGSNVAGRFVNWQVGALNQDSEYAGVIANSAGAARLYKVGSATLTLSGANTYTGDTQLNGGTLKIGNGGATGSLAATNVITTAGTTLIFDRDNSADSSYPGILSGPGTVIKRGAGRVNFYGLNTYTAGTSIEGGVIGINSSSSLGDAAGAVSFTVSDGGVMATAPGILATRNFSVASGITASFGAATAADSYEISSAITGAGSLAINGSGVMILSGANAYGGTTTVSSGTLVAANATGSATSTGAVSLSGGTLGGTGTLSGAVTTTSGVHLRPGAVSPTATGVGTLTTGALALAGGTVLHTEFSDATTYDKIVVSNAGGLTSSASLATPVLVDLRVTNSVAKWTTPGTYDLIQFSGSFSGNANDLFEVDPASQQAGLTYTFSVAGNAIRLTIGGALPSIWNIDGPGNWTTAGNWVNGAPNAVGSTVTFGSVITAPRTVTLDANRTAGILQFNNANAYTIAGSSTLALDQASGSAEVNVLQGDHVISAKLSLNDSLTVGMAAAADSLSLLGDISGAGGITKSSAGDLTLAGNNSFNGPVDFSHGVLTFSNNSLGNGSLTLDAATLVWASGNSQDISNRTINFGDNPITFSMDGNVTLANNFGFTGAAPLSKDGFGTLTIAADTNFTGNLTVLNGNLTLGSGGTAGAVAGDIALTGAGSVLTVDRSDSPVITSLISGTGDLVLLGAGDKFLTRPNTFSGATTISAGKLVLADALALQNSRLFYNNTGGTLDFDNLTAATLGSLEGDKDLPLDNASAAAVTLTVGGNNAATAYTGVFSGGGSLTKIGTGVMTLSTAHTFTGSTTVNGGVLELQSTAVLNNAAINVGPTGRMTILGGSVSATATSNVAAGPAGPATFDLNGGSASFPGGLNALGNSANNFLITASNGATLTTASLGLGRSGLIITAEPVEGSAGTGFYVNGADVDIAGGLSMGMTGAANSSVSARIDAGSLDIGGPIVVGLNNGGRWSVIDVNGGSFTSTEAAAGITLGGPLQGNAIFLARAGVSSMERFQFGQGAIAGTSVVHVLNTGELYVGSGGMVVGSTAPGFVATLKLSGGTLGAKAAWSTAIPVTTAGLVTVKAADALGAANNITLSGAVTGTGSLDKTGDGVLSLNGTYAYTGSTTVSDGTLTLPTATLSDTASVEVKTGGALNLTHGQQDTVSAFIVDGADQGAGVFTSVTHPGLITGSGSLRVVSDPFAAWMAGFPSLTGADAEKTADPDRDGMTNFEEFALDGNPTVAVQNGKVRAQIETIGAGQALVITLPVRTGATFDNLPGPAADATIDKVVYTIRGSNDLAAYDQPVSEIAVSSAGMPALNSGWTYRTFRLNGDLGGGASRGPRGQIDIEITEAAP